MNACAPPTQDMLLNTHAMQPTVHRVINADPSRSRVSLPFFYEPAFEAVIAPLTGLCSASNPPKIPAVRYGSHLESKVSLCAAKHWQVLCSS